MNYLATVVSCVGVQVAFYMWHLRFLLSHQVYFAKNCSFKLSADSLKMNKSPIQLLSFDTWVWLQIFSGFGHNIQHCSSSGVHSLWPRNTEKHVKGDR